MSGEPDPKPEKPTRDGGEAATRKKLRERVCRLSETTLECARPATDAHHLVYGPGGRGSDVEENLVPLCHECHMEAHSSNAGQRYRLLIGLTLRPEERRFILGKAGSVYLFNRYGQHIHAADLCTCPNRATMGADGMLPESHERWCPALRILTPS